MSSTTMGPNKTSPRATRMRSNLDTMRGSRVISRSSDTSSRARPREPTPSRPAESTPPQTTRANAWSPFCASLSRVICPRSLIVHADGRAHCDDPEFGYRFLADEVHAAGFNVGERTVWRRCSENGWWSVFGKKKTRKRSKPGTPSHEDLVRREFSSDAPNRLWLADITEHRTGEGKLYLCAIKDVFSNRIVGWAIDERMKARLVVAALETAVDVA